MKPPVYKWQPTTMEIAARAGIDPGDVIRFDHNTSPATFDWIGEAAPPVAPSLNEYPGADYRPLREAIARYTDTHPDQVVAGAGADELILLSAGCFIPNGGTAVSAPPTYTLYRVATAQREATLIEVPRAEDNWGLDVDRMVDAATSADLVWLCVPNNPTGQRDRDRDIRSIIESSRGVVVLDAAYAEFTGDRWSPWLDQYPNLIVLGTLSKAFALAGARVGYSLSSAELASRLHALRPPGSISTLSAALAERALDAPEWAGENVAAVVAQRGELVQELKSLGLELFPSQTNFVLAKLGPETRNLADAMMWEDGIVVRSFPEGSTLEFYLRFTVRSPTENIKLISALSRRLQ